MKFVSMETQRRQSERVAGSGGIQCPPQRLWGVLWTVLWFVLSAGVLPSVLLAADAQSLESFLELKPKWPELVGLSFRIEGQYAILGRDSLRMKHCELPFRSAQPLRISSSSRVIEVSGRLAREAVNGKLYFEIDTVRELPSDLQTMSERERILFRGNSKQWYELAAWASARAKFYDDKELLERALLATRKALNLERQELSEVTPQALRTLSKRVRELGLDDSLRLDWLHESYVLEWESLQKTLAKAEPTGTVTDVEQDPLFQFLGRLDKDLPGAGHPIEPPLPMLANEYRQSPIQAYRQATDSTRRTLERLLHIEVAFAALSRLVRPDRRNGSEIADRFDELIPERHDHAERLRDAELEFLARNAATLTRHEISDLVRRCGERKLDTLAKEALKRWFIKREESLRKGGVTGLMQLAQERIALLQDQPGAGALLMEALQLAPGNADVIEQLKNLGYREVDGQWVSPNLHPPGADASKPPVAETELERNIRLGIPMVGMTSVQLLKCLGTPQSLTRIASSGRVTETWIYRDGATVKYSATILRQPNRGTAEVVAIH
jgi:hypothetical protein